MGCSPSAEEKVNKTEQQHLKITQLLKTNPTTAALLEAAKAIAAEREQDAKNGAAIDPKVVLQQYVDPNTELSLYHLLCYGEYNENEEYCLNMIKDLTEKGLIDNINAINSNTGMNALHFACARIPDEATVKKRANEGGEPTTTNNDIVMYLLTEGVDCLLQDNGGRTPLMFAARAMNVVAMRELVGRGATATPVDRSGKNVFHHFMLAFGTRPHHLHISVASLLKCVSGLIAVANNEAKNAGIAAHRRSTTCRRMRAADRLSAHTSVEECDCGTHTMREKTITVPIGKGTQPTQDSRPRNTFYMVDPALANATAGSSKEDFVFTPFLFLLREFSFNQGSDEPVLQNARAEILKLLVKNGFSFFPSSNQTTSSSDVHARGFYEFLAAPNDGQKHTASAIMNSSDKEVAFEAILGADSKAAPTFLCRLDPEDVAAYRSNRKGIPAPPARNAIPIGKFDSRIFSSVQDRDNFARTNALAATIVLGHLGFFKHVLENYGFKILINPIPIGNRNLTPLHMIFGIQMEDEGYQHYFVERCIDFALEQADKENFFEEYKKQNNGTPFSFLTLMATSASNSSVQFAPFDVRGDVYNLLNALRALTPTGTLSSSEDNVSLSETGDGLNKTTHLLSCLLKLSPSTLQRIVPVCDELQTVFFANFGSDNHKTRAIKTLLINDSIPAGSYETIFETYFPNVEKLIVRGNVNSRNEDINLLAAPQSQNGKTIPAFKEIEFINCTSWILPLAAISSSEKLLSCLEKLTLRDCSLKNGDLDLFAMTNFNKPTVRVVVAGGEEMKKHVEAAIVMRNDTMSIYASDGAWNTLEFVYEGNAPEIRYGSHGIDVAAL